MSDLMEQIFDDIRLERKAQDAKFGKQMHPNGTSAKFKPMADSARNACQKAADSGQLTWMHVMREEFWESQSETDRARLRVELIQLISVGVAWVECLDEQDG